ncbi:thiamine biosynthesis protein ThiS [Alkalilimnicola ehrlichii]|uniref:Thiamine biosynthesis protein ThiS n=1 Tax=Alkalilimnicola ehrlichii TaxID=351052 RepID=A0A3E0WPG6_9GAMM|nr:sulfur carrier protein ThiS [Alkalilimnicola ehrlichii]RFA26832.1 thiamine biosynthesis protein ThiS [Alkalilimnicola ehrlichii]RFA33927.1 thiamine biosynthesis protein ThiS [Alkalilimnicola ehrlichii]
MDIILNGETHTVRDGISAAELIDELGLTGRRLALEVNEEIVPRSRLKEHPLAPGDRVEIVHAIGGG